MSYDRRRNPGNTSPHLTVQQRARLHEKTVQAIAKGEVPKLPRKARKTAPAEHPTFTGVVDPRVLTIAKRIITNGTYTRWEAVGPYEVIVR